MLYLVPATGVLMQKMPLVYIVKWRNGHALYSSFCDTVYDVRLLIQVEHMPCRSLPLFTCKECYDRVVLHYYCWLRFKI